MHKCKWQANVCSDDADRRPRETADYFYKDFIQCPSDPLNACLFRVQNDSFSMNLDMNRFNSPESGYPDTYFCRYRFTLEAMQTYILEVFRSFYRGSNEDIAMKVTIRRMENG